MRESSLNIYSIYSINLGILIIWIAKGKKYINDVSIEEDPNSTWRHNLFFELVQATKGNFYWPTIVIIDGNDEKVAQLPGFKSKPQLLRNLEKLK